MKWFSFRLRSLQDLFSGWLKVHEVDFGCCARFHGSGELLFGIVQCGAVAPFCFRDVSFECSYFTVVGDELHGEDRGGNDGSYFVQGRSSDDHVVREVMIYH
ncbi:hypothetical protein PIB30_032480 [Stylosanthes scabra]|uniref:Uncharacterized protein n=1 Tax=Stylosanthes scabra TaxID=79078 RepID=A0ABU6TBV6_9FABA|nr:hypothetical protein [Stylosanthes scabra]